MRIKLIKFIISIFISITIANANTVNKESIANNPHVIKTKDIEITTLKFNNDGSDFDLFIRYLLTEAINLGFSEEYLEAIRDLKFNPNVIRHDRNQIEVIAKKKAKTKPNTINKPTNYAKKYLENHISNTKINKAAELLLKYDKTLTIISNKYKVPKETIVGLWGLESNFGIYQGKYNVLDSLATLAYDGRRRALFVSEFFNALKVMSKNNLTKDQLRGSWAGAMGQTQFMPSSYIVYGADGNNNNKINIWHENEDVFASIANYISSEGWNSKISWGQQVKLPTNYNFKKLSGLNKNKARKASEWRSDGIDIDNSFPNELNMWLIVPDGFVDNAYLVTNNFKVYMHWNNSVYFALANSIFSSKIKEATDNNHQ